VILGRTGSGKTTLARMLVGSYRTLVAIDPKHRLELPGTVTVYGSAEFRNTWPQRGRRVILRPSLEDDGELWNDVDETLARVFRYQRTAVLIDESVDIATKTRIVPAYRRIIRLGRERMIPVYSCSQRPVDLHNDVLSQSEHLFVFDLPLRGDREKAAGIAGDELLIRADERVGAEHGFAYAGPSTKGRVLWSPPLILSASQLPRSPAMYESSPRGTAGG
jgi:DNA helicase HerA-like ATPase